MALGVDSSKIKNYASPYAVFKETDALGSYTGATVESPLIEDFAFTDETAQEPRTDAGGNSYSIDGIVTKTFAGNWMQQDLDTLKALSVTYRNKRLAWVQEIDPTEGIYMVMTNAKVNPSFSYSAPGGQVPFALTPEVTGAAVEIDLAHFANSNFSKTLTGTISVPATGYDFIQIV